MGMYIYTPTIVHDYIYDIKYFIVNIMHILGGFHVNIISNSLISMKSEYSGLPVNITRAGSP